MNVNRTHERYTIVLERTPNNYAAYAPDLPGCIATGSIAEEVKANMQEAIAAHLEAMEEFGIPILEPSTPFESVPVGSEAHLIEIAS